MKTTQHEAIIAFHDACELAVSKGHKDIRKEGWNIKFMNRKKTVGLCDYTKKTVYLSKCFMETNSIDILNNTILHEIAHALAPGDGHGSKWKGIFIHLGGTGQRLNTIAKKAKAAWHVIDKRNGNVIAEYYRKPRRNFSQCWIPGDKGSKGNLELVKAQ